MFRRFLEGITSKERRLTVSSENVELHPGQNGEKLALMKAGIGGEYVPVRPAEAKLLRRAQESGGVRVSDLVYWKYSDLWWLVSKPFASISTGMFRRFGQSIQRYFDRVLMVNRLLFYPIRRMLRLGPRGSCFDAVVVLWSGSDCYQRIVSIGREMADSLKDEGPRAYLVADEDESLMVRDLCHLYQTQKLDILLQTFDQKNYRVLLVVDFRLFWRTLLAIARIRLRGHKVWIASLCARSSVFSFYFRFSPWNMSVVMVDRALSAVKNMIVRTLLCFWSAGRKRQGGTEGILVINTCTSLGDTILNMRLVKHAGGELDAKPYVGVFDPRSEMLWKAVPNVEVIRFERSGTGKVLSTLIKNIRTLVSLRNQVRFTHAVNAYGHREDMMMIDYLLWSSGAPIRVGVCSPPYLFGSFSSLLTHQVSLDSYIKSGRYESVLCRLHESILACLTGGGHRSVDLDLPELIIPDQAAAKRAEAAIRKSISTGREFILLAPTSKRNKMIPPLIAKKLVSRIVERLGRDVLVTCTQNELWQVRSLRSPNVHIIGPLDIYQLAETCRRASCVLAIDNGSMHLACWAGARVVGIFGPTDPLLWLPHRRSGVEVVRTSVCEPCGNVFSCHLDDASEVRSCLNTLDPDDVVDAIIRTEICTNM